MHTGIPLPPGCRALLSAVAAVIFLAGCDSAVITDGSNSHEADIPVVALGDTNGDGVYNDFDLATRAEAFIPFVPPPELGFAHPAGENIRLGRWSEAIDWPQVATGAANLPDGRIVTWSSTKLDGFGGQTPVTHGSIFDPLDNSFADAANPAHNMFCSGLSMLPDGEIFSNGGGAVVTQTSIFENDSWVADLPMTTNRWYPNSTLLPSGQVLTALGADNYSAPEMWTKGEGWSLMPNIDMGVVVGDTTASAQNRDWFPALSVAPDGTLFHAGPTSQMLSLDLTELNGITNHGSREADDTHRLYNTTVMYDIGKILVAGGGEPAQSSAITIDLNGGAPTVAATNPMTHARSMQNSVVLPNGEVIVIGGTTVGAQFSDEGTNLIPEIWNPVTGVWHEVAPHTKPRNYHSTALLLKDGRVAAMGGGLCGNCAINQRNGEIYEPPYLFDETGLLAPRPVITQASAMAIAGNTLSVTGSNNISAFNMVRLAALTHHHTADQRFIPLEFEKTSTINYSVNLPANANVLLPGYYWLFALDANGVPSIGHSIKIEVTTPDFEGSIGVITPENPAQVSYEYFEGDWNVLPDFDELTPLDVGVQSTLSLESALSDDYFAYRFNTSIEIPVTGEYTIYLSSDDGSAVEINGQPVVIWDGIHAANGAITGVTTLAAGTHNVVVTYFEKTGDNALSVDIQGQQLVRQPITNLATTDTNEPPEGGVHYEYYEGNWNALPNFNTLTPVLTGRQDTISLEPALRDDYYGFRFTAEIDLPAAGNYTFYLKSDDGTELMVNGLSVVNNDGLHNDRLTKSGTVALDAGTHEVVVTHFEKTGRNTLSVEVEGPQLVRTALSNIVSGDFEYVPPPVETPSGVFYEYYEGFWNALPDFDALTPTSTGEQAEISLTPATSENYFGLRFTAQVELPAAGEYTFYITSDDGSKVQVNGQIVVDNDGLHGAKLKSGTATLPAGPQEIVVVYFEKTGRTALSVEIEGPATARQPLSNLVMN